MRPPACYLITTEWNPEKRGSDRAGRARRLRETILRLRRTSSRRSSDTAGLRRGAYNQGMAPDESTEYETGAATRDEDRIMSTSTLTSPHTDVRDEILALKKEKDATIL